MPHCRGGIRLEYIRRIFPPPCSPAIPTFSNGESRPGTGTFGDARVFIEGRRTKGGRGWNGSFAMIKRSWLNYVVNGAGPW